MDTNNVDKETQNSHKKITKRRKSLRITLLTLLILILGATGVTASELYWLSPQNHFKNLKAIGINTANAKNASTDLSQYKEKSGVFNILLIGSDAHPGDTASHTDSMLLVHADMNNHTYNIVSIPRDTRVYMQGHGYTKLTSVQYIAQAEHGTQQGSLEAVQAISNLTGVPINYYAETNYWGLRYMVDAIGGINMKVPFNVTLTHPWFVRNKHKVITKGTHFFSGEMVTEIVHERDSVPGTDYGR